MKDYKGLFDIDYRVVNGKPRVYLFIQNEDGTKKVETVDGFEPYFYVDEDVLETKGVSSAISQVSSSPHKTIFGKNVRKCVVKVPKQVYYAREFYKVGEGQDCYKNVYEADVLFSLRFAIDEVGKVEKVPLHVLTMDIETTCDDGFPNAESPTEKITCVSAHDSVTNNMVTFVWREDLQTKVLMSPKNEQAVLYFNNESEMLEAFLNYWHKVNPSIVTGWNVASFDIKYMLARLKYLNIPIKKLSCVDDKFDIVESSYGQNLNKSIIVRPKGEIEILGTVIFDALRAYKQLSFGERVSYALKDVAVRELGKEKERILDFGDTWKEDIEQLIKYNRKDVQLVIEINKKMKLIDVFDEVKRFSGVRNINDCFFMSRIHDTNILRKYHNKVVFPSKPPYQERTEDEKVQGAYVQDLVSGLYENVAVLDFSGFYPNIIKTFNLSPEQINDNGVEINGVKLLQDEMGIMPSVVDELLKLKKDLKKQMKGTGSQDLRDTMFAIKVVINSIWGCFALKSFRLFDSRLANNVTFLARQLIKEAIRIVKEDYGYDSVASDTDSCFIKIPSELNAVEEGSKIQKHVNQKLIDFINERYKVRECSIDLGFEKVYKKLLLQKKKHYAGLISWEEGEEKDEIKDVGFASRRSDSSLVGKQVQKQLFEIILRGDVMSESKNKCIMHAKELADNMINGKISIDEIALPKKLNKAAEKYEKTAPRLRGVEWSNKNLGTQFRAGSKFKMVYVKHPETDCVCFEEVEQIKDLKIDWEAMLERNVIKKIKPIFEALGWVVSFEQLESYIKNKINGQQTLF